MSNWTIQSRTSCPSNCTTSCITLSRFSTFLSAELEFDNSAVAASYALRKIPNYLRALRQLEERRANLGLQMRRELAVAEAHRTDDPDQADTSDGWHFGAWAITRSSNISSWFARGRLTAFSSSLIGWSASTCRMRLRF